MENFLYITSHDLNSPLVNVQGFSQNLLRDFNALKTALEPAKLPEEIQSAVDELAGRRIPAALGYITESVERMDQLISAVLKVSRLGRVEMSPKVVDVNVVMDNILAVMRYQLEESGAAVKTGDLPHCKADAGAVSQILMNLLSNAVRYRDQSRKPKITVRGKKNGGGVVLYAVSDNGIGIKPADLPDIWHIFSGGKSSVMKSGEGIGLPMCRMLAEKNGGRIWAESKEGAGSTFFLELPA
jgi:signal transduction histidine kinase